jgi:hypothetical protein
MEYLHKELDLAEGDTVEVNLGGNAANVLLLDPENFRSYQQDRPYRYAGGYARISPFRIPAPHAGRWHLVVDLGGGAGRVQASVHVISGTLTGRTRMHLACSKME